MMGNLPRWKKYDLPGKKTWQAKSWQDKADKRRFLIAGLTWGLLLMTGLISSFLWDSPTNRVHLILFLFQDLNRFFVIINSMILSLSTILLNFIEDLPVTITSMCSALRLDGMHASLPDLKYRSPPLWWSIVIGCPCLPSKAFFVLSMHWLICVLAFHSNASTMPILGCPRRLLLSLFIKLDSAPQVWCCLIHHEGFSLLDSSENYPLIGCVHLVVKGSSL